MASQLSVFPPGNSLGRARILLAVAPAAFKVFLNLGDDYEISRVIVTGNHKIVTVDCHAKANRRWHASAGDVDTGCPPSIVAQMIATGAITQRGVLVPEMAVPVRPFFSELRKRGMKIVMKEIKP